MDIARAKACILRAGGTNCDLEVKVALEELGLKSEILHMNQVRDLSGYHMLVFPGGFSYGDYVRAGAIWGKEIYTKLGRQLGAFVEEGRLVLGICNGFQVLVEAGLLPSNTLGGVPTAALANNSSAKYECRWIHMRVEGSATPFASAMEPGTVLNIPIGHGEGRFLLPTEGGLDELIQNRQVVFRYSAADGSPAQGRYPQNPNGATYDIAAVCNKEGNVMGMMPHPERAFFGWQMPAWGTRPKKWGDGRKVLEGAVKYLEGY
jgi:phosphoribosylformylglycinamidine synthase